MSESDLDATEDILAVVDFNEPPGPGNQYVLIELTEIYQGTNLAEPGFAWKLVAPDSVFVSDGLDCGTVPSSIST